MIHNHSYNSSSAHLLYNCNVDPLFLMSYKSGCHQFITSLPCINIRFVLGLGPGWKPSVLNSAEELDIIEANVRELSIDADIYIGGSSNIPGESTDFGFSDYLTDSSGID